MKTKNYLFYNKEYPAHFSIGAVVLNKDNRIMCHHFDRIGEFENLYILMRETPEQNESVEQTLERGLMEEFGARAEIANYLGSIIDYHDGDGIKNIQKTTLYFLCKLIDFDLNKRAKDDPESSSEIVFLPLNELKEKMKEQGKRYPNKTVDESSILQRISL